MANRCRECAYWQKDYGTWCINGWTGMCRDDGHCHYEVRKVGKSATDFCHHFREATEDYPVPVVGQQKRGG